MGRAKAENRMFSSEQKSQLKKTQKNKQKKKSPRKPFYLSGTYIEDREAPIPGVPWRTGLLVMANSPR